MVRNGVKVYLSIKIQFYRHKGKTLVHYPWYEQPW
jgi:hypothetical protein